MNKVKIALLSTALMLSMNQIAQAAYTQDQLDTLRTLTVSQDTEALMLFLKANPELMQGNDPLAIALRDFLAQRSTPLGAIFGPNVPDIAEIPDLPEGVVTSAELDFGATGVFGS